MSTTLADTLRCDTTLLHAWQRDAAFDYQRELNGWQPSLTDWLLEQLSELLSAVFGTETAHAITRPLLIAIGIVVMLLAVWLIYRQHPELFLRKRPAADDTQDGEDDNIYGVDFERAIRQAVADGNYRQAVRHVYLQTLRHLSDHALIDWQLHKTPTQYVGEYHAEDFRQLTAIFLRIRYGNYEATADSYAAACRLQSGITGREGGRP